LWADQNEDRVAKLMGWVLKKNKGGSRIGHFPGNIIDMQFFMSSYQPVFLGEIN